MTSVPSRSWSPSLPTYVMFGVAGLAIHCASPDSSYVPGDEVTGAAMPDAPETPGAVAPEAPGVEAPAEGAPVTPGAGAGSTSTDEENTNMPAEPNVGEPEPAKGPSLPVVASPDEGGFLIDPEIEAKAMAEEEARAAEELAMKAECVGITYEPERIIGQVDVIFVIDNSSSMAGEIKQVEDRINDDFAGIIEAKGLDYRVIMLSRYGQVGEDIGHSNNPICIRAPLGAGTCVDPNSEVLENNPGRFYHFSADMRSREGLCDFIEAFNSPDEILGPRDRPWPREFDWVSVAPNGFGEHMRPGSTKHIIYITDDHSRCDRQGVDFNDGQNVAGGERVARAFHEQLVGLSPDLFGTMNSPKYVFHSIIGMASKPAGPDGIPPPWEADEPIQLDRCSDVGGAEGVDGNGTAYQALSIMTGGLRYPSCYNDNFDAIFNAIAGQVVNGSFSCEWEIPTPPDGEVLDPTTVNVEHDPTGDPPAYRIPGVPSVEECGPQGGWYYDNPAAPERVITCPATCLTLKEDALSKIDITFGCATEPPPPLVVQ